MAATDLLELTPTVTHTNIHTQKTDIHTHKQTYRPTERRTRHLRMCYCTQLLLVVVRQVMVRQVVVYAALLTGFDFLTAWYKSLRKMFYIHPINNNDKMLCSHLFGPIIISVVRCSSAELGNATAIGIKKITHTQSPPHTRGVFVLTKVVVIWH